MGWVLVLVDAPFGGYDAVPDPVGWLLVLAGLLALRRTLPAAGTALRVAVLALLVSLATYPPAVADALTPGLGWFLSLPQLAVGLLLCALLAPRAGHLGRRLRVLRTVLLAVAVAPVLVLGGGLTALAVPTAGVAVLSQIYLVYLLFRLSGRDLATASRPAAG